jgi:hypothetical protein
VIKIRLRSPAFSGKSVRVLKFEMRSNGSLNIAQQRKECNGRFDASIAVRKQRCYVGNPATTPGCAHVELSRCVAVARALYCRYDHFFRKSAMFLRVSLSVPFRAVLFNEKMGVFSPAIIAGPTSYLRDGFGLKTHIYVIRAREEKYPGCSRRTVQLNSF